MLPEPRLAPELSCCWQDAQGSRPPAKPVQPNALGRKLSCCWQDCEAYAADPGLVAVGGCVRRWPDGFPGGVASTRDSESAICGSCPDRPAGIPDHRRPCGGGHRSAAAADSRIRRRPIDRAETSMAGKPAHNTDTAVGPYRVVALNGQAKNLETDIEYVLRPRRWLSQQQNRWKCGRFIPVLTQVEPPFSE